LQFPSPEEQKIHFKSDFHRYNLKRKVLGLAFVTLSEFEQKVGANTANTAPAPQKEPQQDPKHQKRLELKKQKEELYKQMLEGKTEELDDDSCPMCKKKVIDIQHLASHGLFVPPQPEKLLSFIHTKVTKINCCLYCDKQFYTLEQVIHHMKSVGHVKLNDVDYEQFLEDEDSSDEWEDASDDGNMEVVDEDDEENVAYIDNEELTLPNGKVLGSRHMMRYYKQNLTPSAAHGSMNAVNSMSKGLISTRGGAGQLTKSHAEIVKEKEVKKASLKELKKGNEYWARVGQKHNMLQHHYREQNPF
jgi:pre-60S factor REI1